MLKEYNFKNKIYFYILLILATGYYIWRMIALTPWYDELYTYYYFVSKGPVYAAIHWPLPNNHVGYSVLSGCLSYIGNAQIALRGVSLICAVLNLVLLYAASRLLWNDFCALFVTEIYASFNLVNQLAVQGRGYCLVNTCVLLSLYALIRIFKQQDQRKRWFILFSLGIGYAIYAIPSSIYVVLMLCFGAGVYILVEGHKQYSDRRHIKLLLRLIGWSVLAAVCVLALYGVLWLAIGSNLLVKDAQSLYYGMGHGKVILSHPFLAIGTGIQYMLATPYIQSVGSEGFVASFLTYWKTLLQYMWDKLYVFLLLVIVASMVFHIVSIIKKKKNLVFSYIQVAMLLGIPALLFVLKSLPYYRVLSFMGIFYALCFGDLCERLYDVVQDKLKNVKQIVIYMLIFISFALLFVRAGSYDYVSQYGQKEHEISEIIDATYDESYTNPCITDVDIQYLMLYNKGIRCENTEVLGADYVIFDKNMMDSSYEGFDWEFLVYYNDIDWAYVNDNMQNIMETDHYEVYVRRQ